MKVDSRVVTLVAVLLGISGLATGPEAPHASAQEPLEVSHFTVEAHFTQAAYLTDPPPVPPGSVDRPLLPTPNELVNDEPQVASNDITETDVAAEQGTTPQAPGTIEVFRDTSLAAVTAGFHSSIGEPNLGSVGRAVFQSGNWYAAISGDNGATFSFVNPFTTFPTTGAFAGGFCCDQRIAQDSSRNAVFWYLQYTETGSNPAIDTNGVRIAVAGSEADLIAGNWCYFNFTPATFGFAAAGKFLDYPHLSLTNTYLYATSNVFDIGGALATHALVWRMSIADLLACSGAPSVSYFSSTTNFSIVGVQGASDTMYLASVTGNTSIGVYTWTDAGSLTVASVTGLFNSVSAAFSCTGPDGRNSCGRASRRMQGGWVRAGELGFMWNSAQDAANSRSYPFVRVVLLNPSTKAVLSQPDIYGNSNAWLYPSVAVDARGHIGGTVWSQGGSTNPLPVGFIWDDLTASPPAPWETIALTTVSDCGTNSRWGDYSGTQVSESFPNTWIVGTFRQEDSLSGSDCSTNSDAEHHFAWFGRERDTPRFLVSHQLSGVAVGGEVAIFGRAPDDVLWYRETTAGTFGGWVEVGDSVASRPEAVMTGADLYVFFRGTDNALHYYKRTGGVWGTDQSLGGVIAGDPVAAVDGDGDVIVMVLNGAGNLFYQRLSGGNWSGYQSLFGVLSGELELQGYEGDLHLFAYNGAGLLWTQVWDAGTDGWGGWTPLDGVLTGGPAASAYDGNLYVFGVNPDGILFYRASNDGSAWGGWTPLDGVLGDAPDVASTASEQIVLGANLGGNLWERTNDGSFGGWTPLDGVLTSGPEVIAVGDSIYAFGLNEDGNLWYRKWNGASWEAWSNLGGILATE